MAATGAKEAEQHTPFCERDCKISHHELIKALFSFNNFSDGYSNPGTLHSFYENVQSCISRGWDKDSIVPDDSRDLQCPLVYLACAFGKHKALTILLKMDFEPSGCIRQTGETALHAAVRYIYQSGAWSVNNSKKGVTKVRPKTRTASFEKILMSLCEKSPEIIGQKDINWDTPLHVGAQELADIQKNELDCSGRKLMMALNNRKIHFKQCLRSMLLKVCQLEEQGVISAERAMQIICCKNRERKSVLNILSENSGEKDTSLEFLTCILSKLGKRLSPATFPKKDIGLETQTPASQETVNSVVSPLNTQRASETPLPLACTQVKQSWKETFKQIEGKEGHAPAHKQSTNTKDMKEESSTIHVVFGHRDESMMKVTGYPLRSLPGFTPSAIDAIMTKISEPDFKKQTQRKPKKSRRKSSELFPRINNTSSSLMQNQSDPETLNNNLTSSEKPRLPRGACSVYGKDHQPSNTTVCSSNENLTIVDTSNPLKINLRKEIRESYQAAFSLEKECFRLESERLECLHGIKERKELIENLQKEIVQLEQKATFLANSKSVLETDWKVFQQKEKDLKVLLHSFDSNNIETLSSKKRKLE